MSGLGDKDNSIILDDEILKLYSEHRLSKEVAIDNAKNREIMRKKIG